MRVAKRSKWRINKLRMPPLNFKSKVWQYFGFEKLVENGIKTLDRTKTVCKVCKVDIAYGTGNTTNMFTYLQRRHPQIYQELAKPKVSQNQPNWSTKSIGVAPSGQLRLHDFLKTELSSNSPRPLE